MKTIASVEELVKHGCLENGDEVIFKIKEEKYRCQVKLYYLNVLCPSDSCDFPNDIIFDKLNLDKMKIARAFYGYESLNRYGSAQWPEFEELDYRSLSRLVMGLFVMTGQLCAEEKEKENMIYIKRLHGYFSEDTIIEAMKKQLKEEDPDFEDKMAKEL